MKQQVPIQITHELTDEVIESTGLLELASGRIQRIEYRDHDPGLQGAPWEHEDYEFTSGTLSSNGKDVEFGIQVNRQTGELLVSASELREIKARAAALFADVAGPEPTPGATPARRGRPRKAGSAD